MNIKCLFQHNMVPKKDQGASSQENSPRHLAPTGLSVSPATLVTTARMHSKAHVGAGGSLVTFNAIKKPLFLATQIHLPWSQAAFQRHTSKCGLDSSNSGELQVFLSLTPPRESGSRPGLRARIPPFWRQSLLFLFIPAWPLGGVGLPGFRRRWQAEV